MAEKKESFTKQELQNAVASGVRDALKIISDTMQIKDSSAMNYAMNFVLKGDEADKVDSLRAYEAYSSLKYVSENISRAGIHFDYPKTKTIKA